MWALLKRKTLYIVVRLWEITEQMFYEPVFYYTTFLRFRVWLNRIMGLMGENFKVGIFLTIKSIVQLLRCG
jgi:hypothetical protein